MPPPASALVAALEQFPLAVALFDDAGCPVFANRAARALVDRNETNIDAVCRAVAAAGGPVAAVLAGEALSSGFVRIPADRGVLDREVTAAAVVDEGGARFVVATFHADTDVRMAGVAGRELQQRLELMLEHTSEIISVLDAAGTVLFSNAAAGRLTGFPGTTVNGTSAFDLIHPDDAPHAARIFGHSLATPGPSGPHELRLRYADGTWHDVEVVLNNRLDDPAVGGIVVTIHDVTDRKRDQALLARSEARLRSLVQNLSDVIVVLDAGFQVTYVSPAIERIVRAPADTNIGMHALNDIHPDDVGVALDVLREVAASPMDASRRVELRIETEPGSGQWRWVEAVAVNRLDDPAVAGLVCTLRDITEKKQRDAELQTAYDREREAAAALRELDRLKDEFLTTVSHELRTPLTAIVGFASLLDDPGIDAALRRELLERIAANASEMEVMVEQLLDFSRLQAGRVAVSPRPLALADVVDAAVARLTHQLAAHDVIVAVPPGLHALADADALGHIVDNLLVNAAKYSQPGTRIEVGAVVQDGRVVLCVRDEGMGIAPDLHERVFERFYRAPDAAHAGRRGSGVGLSVVQQYAHLLGGDVWLESAEGRGSAFFVALPRA